MVRTAKGRGEQLEEEGPSQWPDVSAWFIHLSHRRWSSREPGKIGPALGTEVKSFCIKFSETKFLGTVALVWHYVIVVGQQRNVFTVDAHDIK